MRPEPAPRLPRPRRGPVATGVGEAPIRWHFWLRATAALTLVVAIASYLGGRFRLGIDDQVRRCLPPHWLFLIDREARAPARGALVAFRAEGLAPYFADGTTVVKAVVGVPGDRVEVDADAVRVNGERVGSGLALAGRLGQPVASFARDTRVPPGHLWVMGRSADSFDSRYWGFLPAERVIGRAHALR